MSGSFPRLALLFSLAALVPAVFTACTKKDDADQIRPEPPPPGAMSARADVCGKDGAGGIDTHQVSASFVPRALGGYCLDPQGEPKTYGDKGKFTMDEVCTTAFDGECEVYKRFGLDRVVALRYLDGSGAPTVPSVGAVAPNSVEVNLSRFKTIDGAYAMFTKRVVADGDPARATVKSLAAGAAGATSSSNAYVWRGLYLAELTFVTEDTKMTPQAMAAANEKSTGALARDIGSKLPGDPLLPDAARALPTDAMIPLGIAYYPKDAISLSGIGPIAVGYYKNGDKRWRAIAAVRADADAAKEVWRAFKLKAGSLPVKGLAEDAVQVIVQEAPERAKAEYLVARKGTLVAGIGDEELVLDPATPADKQAPLKLTHEEKIMKLAAWLNSVK
jgi:hypothetical protein